MNRKSNARKLTRTDITAFVLNAESEDNDSYEPFEKIQRSNARSEACDDDREYTAPYVDLLPEESYHEHGSPLRF